ncbi:MAG TPA: glycogen/starch synthase [Candidatus Acidoferrum sp.]|nr:glycogen/starch synthase [Candidatus Acidoferrum sp.]
MKIVHVTSEFFPFSKTGGLAHAVSDIAINQAKLGHHVSVFTPYWGTVAKRLGKKDLTQLFTDLPVKLDKSKTLTCSCFVYAFKGFKGSLKIYFISHYDFFGRYKKNLYLNGEIHKRLYFFDQAAFQIISKARLQPAILHLHDWMAALCAPLQKQRRGLFKKNSPKIVLTLHNIGYQGSSFVNDNRYTPKKQVRLSGQLPDFDSPIWQRANFLRAGIENADIITTVSPRYAEEITTKEYGEGLQNVLKKHKIYGILNGIDYNLYNPLSSKKVPYNFTTLNATSKKKLNKAFILRRLGLPKYLLRRPLIITTHRLCYQKGFNLMLEAIPDISRLGFALVMLGEGDKCYVEAIKAMVKKLPNVVYLETFSDNTEEKLMAAADIMLAPSIFEPCGTSHLKAMRYGVVPVAKNTGGLADTISNYSFTKGTGTGFLFETDEKKQLLRALEKAKQLYNQPSKWHSMVLRCMNQSFSLKKTAQEYIELYKLVES